MRALINKIVTLWSLKWSEREEQDVGMVEMQVAAKIVFAFLFLAHKG